MCGILALLSNNNIENDVELKNKILQMSKLLRHRGPDWNGIYQSQYGIFAHERLSIIDPIGGSQPIVSDNGLILCVNGEIYNYKHLSASLPTPYNFKTKSDCEIIMALYTLYKSKNEFINQKDILALLSNLDGMFSFILHDTNNNNTLVARDPFGITPLYYGVDNNNNIYFSSEMKALECCSNVYTVPSGHYILVDANHSNIVPIPYFIHDLNGIWINEPYSENNTLCIEDEPDLLLNIRHYFTNAVIKRLMSDVPFGVLLSGGLDSSLVTSVVVKYFKENPELQKYTKSINTFSIGLEGSPDLVAAQKTADFLGTTHHSFTFTIEEGINALRDVIYHLETYDITTIRASTPMYLMSRKIKSLGFKMVLSGEGSDELLGGYLYFHNAPNDKEHRKECKRRLMELGYFDCLRANKSTMAWGLEARVPFLDKEFVNLCINIDKDMKGTMLNTDKPSMEKSIIRKAFDINDENGNPVYLPKDILWRQKEQFSDGVGYGWIDYLKEYTEKQVNDSHIYRYNMRKLNYPFNTPDTKEAFYYRMIFEELFPNRANTVKKWIPMTAWDGVNPDPSGRTQTVHNNKI
tara:strand:+ start:9507 stop:11243 length:1737 start_codon:yes stop_codon:yes gene_type:complete